MCESMCERVCVCVFVCVCVSVSECVCVRVRAFALTYFGSLLRKGNVLQFGEEKTTTLLLLSMTPYDRL